ncbi:MAG: aldehyde ferredoxin oxidoreductase [Desulfurococcus sp.]|nr:aldehyde ferredoxin oxidoreductase [Desulfurococcus sp.]
MNGFWGRFLEVDLSSSKWRVVEFEDRVFRRFLGGRGFAVYYLAKHYGEKWSSLDPLSPENPLIIATGPLTGYYPGVKMTISGKSPQSNGVVGSTVSSEVAVELKSAGYDGLIVKGASDKPVYLYIEDNRVEVRDAGELWGLTGRVLVEKLAEIARREHKLKRPPASLYIGPAGENKVRTAVVLSKITHASGYGGYGAVMGSKKLKAIVVKGNGPLPPIADSNRFLELHRKLVEIYSRNIDFRRWGTTSGTWYTGNVTSSMPIRNWQEEYHERLEFSHAWLEKKLWVKNPWSEYGCPLACMKLSRVTESGRRYITDGPDYEMAAYMGGDLGVLTPEGATRLSAVADELGLCGIQTGNVVGFALELLQRGILTKEDFGYEVNWGDVNALERLLNDIACRRGIGDILAEGTYRAALKLMELKGRKDLLKYAVQSKGIAIGAHGIRSGKDYPQPIAYAASVQGGDHTSVAGVPVKSRSSEAWSAVIDSAVVCMFLTFHDNADTILLDYLNAVTGWGLDINGLYDIGRRILTLQRLLLLAGGPDVKWTPGVDDENPERFYEPLPSGPYKGKAAERSTVKTMLAQYFSELGWDERGIPKPETLDSLELSEFKGLLELVR